MFLRGWQKSALLTCSFGRPIVSVLVSMVNEKPKLTVSDVMKRLEETRAKAAKLKAATERMEDVVHEMEERIHAVEANAKEVHAKIRKPRSQRLKLT